MEKFGFVEYIVYSKMIDMEEHKSIFSRINEYSSNPIAEFLKLQKFLKKKCESYTTVEYVLSEYFHKSSELIKIYVDFEDCIEKNTEALLQCKLFSNNKNYLALEESTKIQIMDEFLTYCEIIAHIYFVSMGESNFYSDNIIYNQIIKLIEGSLKSIGYEVRLIDEISYTVEIFKVNPEAEYVADKSSLDIKKTIYKYLGSRNSDVENRKNLLHNLIDLLEPTLKKYSNQTTVNKIKEYSQLLRHPEINKGVDKYKWFYKDMNSHFDEIFELCIFVLYYEISSKTINEYNHNTYGN